MSEAVSSTLPLPTRRYRIRNALWIALGVVGFLLATGGLRLLSSISVYSSAPTFHCKEALNRRVDVNEVRLRLIPTPSTPIIESSVDSV